MKKNNVKDNFKAGKVFAAASIVLLVIWTIILFSGINGNIISGLLWDAGRSVIWIAFCIFMTVCAVKGKSMIKQKFLFYMMFASLAAGCALSLISVFGKDMGIMLSIGVAMTLIVYTLVTAGALVAMMLGEYETMRAAAVFSVIAHIIYTICFTVGAVSSSGLYAINAFTAFAVLLLLMIPVGAIELMGNISLVCFAKKYSGK